MLYNYTALAPYTEIILSQIFMFFNIRFLYDSNRSFTFMFVEIYITSMQWRVGILVYGKLRYNVHITFTAAVNFYYCLIIFPCVLAGVIKPPKAYKMLNSIN